MKSHTAVFTGEKRGNFKHRHTDNSEMKTV